MNIKSRCDSIFLSLQCYYSEVGAVNRNVLGSLPFSCHGKPSLASRRGPFFHKKSDSGGSTSNIILWSPHAYHTIHAYHTHNICIEKWKKKGEKVCVGQIVLSSLKLWSILCSWLGTWGVLRLAEALRTLGTSHTSFWTNYAKCLLILLLETE